MKIFLFSVGTKLQEIGFLFEDMRLQGGLPEEDPISLAPYAVLVLLSQRVVSPGGGVTTGMVLEAYDFKCVCITQ